MKFHRFSVFVQFLFIAMISGCVADPVESFVEEVVEFQSGELILHGTLRVPVSGDPAPLLILYHAASGGSVDFPFYEHLKRELPERGIATFMYNRRGSGSQPGNFETASFEDLAYDGIAAAQILKTDRRIDSERIGAWGISQGGWVAPLAATLSSDISFAISVSGPGVSPAKQMAFTAEYHLREAGFSNDDIKTALSLRSEIDAYFREPKGRSDLQKIIDTHRGADWFSLAFLPNGGNLPDDVTQSKWYFEMDFEPTDSLSNLYKPFLVIFGAKDRWVPVQESVNAIRSAIPDKTLLKIHVFEQSGHLMSGHDESAEYNGESPVDIEYVDKVANWVKGWGS